MKLICDTLICSFLAATSVTIYRGEMSSHLIGSSTYTTAKMPEVLWIEFWCPNGLLDITTAQIRMLVREDDG